MGPFFTPGLYFEQMNLILVLPMKFRVIFAFMFKRSGWKKVFMMATVAAIVAAIGTILFIFDQEAAPILPIKFQVNWLFVKEKYFKLVFQDGCHGGHLGFPIWTILAIFVQQVTLILHNKLRVNWHFSSGEEAQNSFSRWRPWHHLVFTIGLFLVIFFIFKLPWYFLLSFKSISHFSYVWSTSCPDTSYQGSS